MVFILRLYTFINEEVRKFFCVISVLILSCVSFSSLVKTLGKCTEWVTKWDGSEIAYIYFYATRIISMIPIRNAGQRMANSCLVLVWFGFITKPAKASLIIVETGAPYALHVKWKIT